MMNKQMESLNYNTEKFPLGKLKKKTITDGYNALKELSLVLTDSQPSEPSNKKKEIERLQRPPLINSPQALKEKLQLVESLAEIEIAQSLMKVGSLPRDADGNLMNRLDAHFASLKLNKLESFDHAHNEFVLIRDYVKNTHGQTHSGYDLEVVDAFRLERHSEPERLTNFVGILSQGLRIAPPEAPVSGYMFGKGVYFADCVSKSANYCFTNQTDNEALMLLCEVALGETYELTNSDFYAAENSKKAGKTATLGVGRSQPDPKGKKYLNDGTLVPCGQVINPETPQARNTCLQYNEVGWRVLL
ncbi:hypothetical protein BC936DRAFT_137060 [Jimgerdemannia flammicorona]|uniref:Poly [ADP-ribose] polymerase n=1 Tax=Jimgerdemannia flammicorona TaxID=994334 RepID=A0A433DJ80_9FUNG|nr:hypothetical protein BC936DRAFT_137060 [Jimgerdemannia flammicorona]